MTEPHPSDDLSREMRLDGIDPRRLTPVQRAACMRSVELEAYDLGSRSLTPHIVVEQEFVLSTRRRGSLPPRDGVICRESMDNGPVHPFVLAVLQKRYPHLKSLRHHVPSSERTFGYYTATFNSNSATVKDLVLTWRMMKEVMDFRAHIADDLRDAKLWNEPDLRATQEWNEEVHPLSPLKSMHQGMGLYANMLCIPFPRHPNHEKQSLAMRMKLGLFDGEGKNLCGSQLFSHDYLGEALLRMHTHAGLAYLQTGRNMRRFGHELCNALDLPLGDCQDIPHALHSWHEVGNPGTVRDHMMGADADMYVAGALALATMLRAVRAFEAAHPQFTKQFITLEKLMQVCEVNRHPEFINTGCDHMSWTERFQRHDELQNLLGEALYYALLGTYGKRIRGELPPAAGHSR